jgi:hypothetical protein
MSRPTHEDSRPGRSRFWREIGATRVIVSTLGVLIAVGGMDHGLFEVFQGNKPTGGLIVHAIGEQNRMWAYGTEDAFTLIPNFLISGVAAIVVSVLILVWSVGFVHKKNGSLVFLLLSILLFLVGGGVAQVVFFTLAWAVSTRINKPVTWLRVAFPESVRGALAKLWLWLLIVFTLLALIALEIAIVGYVPRVSDPKLALHICWSILAVGLGILLAAFVCGFAHDLDQADWQDVQMNTAGT